MGVFPAAFALRAEERDLSVDWLEHYHGDRRDQMRQVAEHAELKLNSRHGYSVIQVKAFSDACSGLGAKVRIVHEPTTRNPAHSVVHQYPRDNDEIQALLANLAGQDLTLVGDIS